jgi:hypothetical protein
MERYSSSIRNNINLQFTRLSAPDPSCIKDLISDMKHKNSYWGYQRIQGELLKFEIELKKNNKDSKIS